MKHDAWRRDLAMYAWRGTIEPRWADVDTLRHLNNSALHGLHQEARMRLLTACVGDAFWRGRGPRLLAAQVHTDFLLQAHYPQPLEAGARVIALDAARLTLATGLFQDGRCVGLQTTQVVAAERDRPVELPAAWRHALAAGAELPPPEALPPPPTLPPPAAWPQRRSLDTRYADLDANGRASELSLMRAAEVGRAALLRTAFAALDPTQAAAAWVGTLVARIDLHRQRQAPPPPGWQLGAGVTHLGRSSVVVRVGFFGAADEVHAHADCVQVFVDRASGKPVAMPDAVRSVLDGQRLQA